MSEFSQKKLKKGMNYTKNQFFLDLSTIIKFFFNYY